MKVLYDHQIYQHQRFGGVSRYFTEIIEHLPENVDFDVSVLYSFNEYLKATSVPFKFDYQLFNLPHANFKGKARVLSFLEKNFPAKYPNRFVSNQANTIQKLRAGDFDIFHPTFFEDYYLDYMNGKPYVLTIHDMIIELYPEFINSPEFVKRKKKLADNAAHIIAVSENTKRDIIDVFNISPDKISVVYHGSSLTGTILEIDLPTQYLLYVGDRRLGYKNFMFFMTALLPILNENQNLKVLCTGSEFTQEEINFFNTLGVRDRMVHRFVDEKDLYTVYNKAEMFIYPSYYEGFGIPILEAFQAECPVMLTNSSCFEEVASDAALYFDPKSAKQLQDNIRLVLTNPVVKQDIVTKGKNRLANYSWDKSALQTVEVYKQVLGK